MLAKRWIGTAAFFMMAAGSAAGWGEAQITATSQAVAQGVETHLAEESTTVGERVNFIVDNLAALGMRILELPLFMTLGGILVVGLGAGWMMGKMAGRKKAGRAARAKPYVVAGTILLACVFVIDRKIANLQQEVSMLRAKNTTDALLALGAMTQEGTAAVAMPAVPSTGVATTARSRGGKREAFLFDVEGARKALGESFGEVTMKPVSVDGAADMVQVGSKMPLVQAYMAVIDLRNPQVRVKLDNSLDRKTLTSDFAQANGCSVAINGEAGNSPAPTSGLGPWRGNFVVEGKVILSEDAKTVRPYLAFDKENRVMFTAAEAVDRRVPNEPYNVIWGRLDALVKGVVQTADERNRQPRTAMGINSDGTRLYLMVVDGRQPTSSLGFTRSEVGMFLKAFGASDGMLCDEGGSSCMYIKQLGGIVNIPSDNQGQERPTYTHFGVVFEGGK